MSSGTIVDKLNEDCWRLVLDLLPIKDIIRSERVSRGWQQVIFRYIQVVDFSIEYPWYTHEGSRKYHVLKMDQDDPEMLSSLTAKWGACIKKADCINEASVKVLRRNCPNLEDVTFYGLPVNVLSNEAPKTFKQLKTVHFRGCDSVRIPHHYLNTNNECFAFCGLTALIFKSYFAFSICGPQVTDKCIKHWLAKDSIEEVAVWGSERVTGHFLASPHAEKLKSLCLKECEALDFRHLLSSVLTGLKKLELIYVPRAIFQNVHLLLEKLPELEELCLRWEKKMDMGGELAECVGRMKLRRLDLSYNPNVSDEWLEKAASGFGRLNELLLEGCLGVTAHGALAACAAARGALRGLHLGSSGHVLDRHVVQILRTCPNLTWLDVSFCWQLSTNLVKEMAGARPASARRLRLAVASTAVQADEPEYRNWWTWEYVRDEFCALSHSGFLNSLFSMTVLAMLVVAITQSDAKVPVLRQVDAVYNMWYGIVVASVVATVARQYPGEPVTWSMKVGFLLDFLSYFHYMPVPYQNHLKVICYFIRVHRPLRSICATDNNTMNSSLLVTTLKYMYYTYVLRIICAYCWIIVNKLETHTPMQHRHLQLLHPIAPFGSRRTNPNSTEDSLELFSALYLVNKIFIPIGPPQSPETDFDRIVFLTVMIIGILMVTGAAVAALSSVISVHMRPEENFRTRYRIIMRDLTSSGIPISLRNKVETFYKMYWHKLRAVSATRLLPRFPPVLPKSVYTDIYFEATQKSGLLRDLSYQFLSEVAKYMETILYIPGDCIIKRNSQKSSIIYITYGDIEMLTAEDDISPMLRFTRGTILTPWGAAAGGRAHVELRAGTFCAARVLRARGLWRAALRHGRGSGQTRLMLAELRDHMIKVKRHYAFRRSPPCQYKSSILQFKNNLMALKEARDANGELLLARPDYLLEIAGCYLMRNRLDTTLTDDSDAICLRQTFPCILQPASSLLTAWNWLVAVLILVVCFTYPYYLVYKKTVSLDFKFFDLMVTVVYVLDIVVYLSTGTNVEEGVPITFIETSSKQVRSPWFILDVLATLPILAFVSDGQFTGLNKLLRFPQVIRVIQTLEEECVYHTNMVRFCICSLILVFTCYFLAAVQQSFVCYGYGYCLVTNFTHEPFWTQGPLDDHTVADRLYFSLYWAISLITFTSHMELGGPLSRDNTVHVFTTILLEVCIVLNIAIEAVYSANIMVTTVFRESFDSCIADAQTFLTRHKVAPQLRQRFIEHLQLCWNTRKAYTMSSNVSSVFYDLPSHVYQDILARQRSKYILCIPFMKLLFKEDLINVSSNARIFQCAPNEILLNTGDISTEMYIIKQGFCEVLNPDTKEIVGTLVAKNHFGVLECLFRLPAFYTVRATTHVRLFSIARKYLVQALEVPQIKDAMDFAKEQEEYDRLLIRREPFESYRPPDKVPNRQCFKLPRKYEKDYAFLQPFKKFGFFSILRNIFPRFTFRPDSALLARYEVCRAFCAVSGAFLFPSYTYLVLQYPWMYYAAMILDLCAYLDIVVRMFVGYFDGKGILVYHPANTAAHYLRGAFFLDVFSCLPLEELEVSMKYSFGSLYQVTAMKQILMLNRLLQMYRLPGTTEVLTSIIERRDIILVLQALPLFMAMLNVLTTLLVFSSVRIYHSADELEWALVPTSDKGGSWIYLFNTAYRFNVTGSPLQLHLGCYFWIVYEATTTGYNTIAPTNLYIMAVLIWAMILGSLLTTYISVRIISLRSNVNNMLAAYQEHMRDLAQFMRRENLPKQLQKEIMDHYELNWEKTDGIDAQNVLRLCDQLTLRSDAIQHLYGPAFAKCPILADCDVSLLRVLGRAVRSIHFLEGTTIFQEDDVINHLYFVYTGQLQLRSVDWDAGVSTVTKLSIGSMVGNLDDTPSMRVSSRLVAATDVHLLQMKSTVFHSIVRDCDFPVVYEHIAKYRNNDELFINGDVTSGWLPRPKQRAEKAIKNLALKSGIVQMFLILTSLLCVYTDLSNAGFQINSVPIVATLYVLDVCFLGKIFLHFAMPELLTLPTEHHEDKERYIKSNEFKMDIASCVPIELLSLLSSNTWLALSLLRLNRMLRANTVYIYLQRYQKRATENLVISTLTLVMWFTVYIHCCTCIWFFIGLQVDRSEPKRCWFYDDYGVPLCSPRTYVCSIYFVLTTFAHNGIADIMPKTEVEVLYVSALLIVSMMVYVVYVGEFSNIVHYASFRAFSYYSKFLELQNFLNNNRVSPVLIALVNKYSVLLWREARGEQLPEFLVTAPLCLKLKVMSHAYKDVGAQHPVFKYCEPALLRQIVGYLKQYYYDENMYVVQQNEITNSMYLVHVGEVQEISESCDEDEATKGLALRVYTPGEYFGVEEGLIRDKPFTYSYRTTIKSQILTLRLDDWEYLLKHFPESKAVIDNFQWDRRDEDDDEDRALSSDGPPPTDGSDPSATVGQPEGSEIGFGHGWSTSDDQSGSSGVPPRMLPNIQPSRDDANKMELQPSHRLLNVPSQKDEVDKSVLSDSEGAKTDREGTQLKDDINSSRVLFSKEGDTEKTPGQNTSISAPSTKIETEEAALPVSSSTQLFERIRNAARALDDKAAKQGTHETQQPVQATDETALPHYSVEEYLAHKYKMRESYTYNYKRKDDNEDDIHIQMSSHKLNQNRVRYMDRSAVAEDYRHLQLAESVSRVALSHSTGMMAILNLKRPLGDQTPPHVLSSDELLPSTSIDTVPPDPIMLEREHSQTRTSEEQVLRSVSEIDLIKKGTELSRDSLPDYSMAMVPVHTEGRELNDKHEQLAPKQSEKTIDIFNKEKRRTSGPDVLVDFDSDVAAHTSMAAPTTRPTVTVPPIKKQGPETQQTEDRDKVVDLDSDAATRAKRSSASATLPALLPPPSSSEPQTPPKPSTIEPPTLSDSPTLPSEPEVTPSTALLEHTRLLSAKDSEHTIVAPREDQVKDLAGLDKVLVLSDSKPTTSKVASKQSGETSDQTSSLKSDSKEVKADTHTSLEDDKSGQKKSDENKASDNKQSEK